MLTAMQPCAQINTIHSALTSSNRIQSVINDKQRQGLMRWIQGVLCCRHAGGSAEGGKCQRRHQQEKGEKFTRGSNLLTTRNSFACYYRSTSFSLHGMSIFADSESESGRKIERGSGMLDYRKPPRCTSQSLHHAHRLSVARSRPHSGCRGIETPRPIRWPQAVSRPVSLYRRILLVVKASDAIDMLEGARALFSKQPPTFKRPSSAPACTHMQNLPLAS